MVLTVEKPASAVRVAVLLLCHEPPEAIARALASAFYRSPEVRVYLHHDRSADGHDEAAFRRALPADIVWRWLPDAVRARWGEWSLVEGTLRLIEAALGDPGFAPTHLLLASGSCRPVRPLAALQDCLRQRPATDFIEAHDLALGRWTRDGLERERYEWCFPFNYQTQRRWFERASALQRWIGVRRRLPEGLRPHFGAQWFCLRSATADQAVSMLRRPALARFLAHTWIPDEFALQTAVAALRPRCEIAGHGLTYHEFDSDGRPLVLEDLHADHVLRQPFFFARKVSPAARALEARLEARVREQGGPPVDAASPLGTPTPEFERFVQALRRDPGRRSRIGAFRSEQGGPMAGNTRRYYVLHGSSPARVSQLLRLARELGGSRCLPIFDHPFDRGGPRVDAPGLRWRGIGPRDRLRFLHDPCAALHELVQIDPRHGTAFGLDAAEAGWVRDFVPRDPHAVLVDCDPPGLTRAQRVALALRDARGRDEAWAAAREAWRVGAAWPSDPFSARAARGDTRCRFARLEDVDFADDATWQALSAAAAALDETGFELPAPVAEDLVAPGREGPAPIGRLAGFRPFSRGSVPPTRR